MGRGEDPRASPACASEVPRLLREGAARFAERRFWDAHEAWEEAWHALRAAREDEQAAYVRGMILVAAGLENATRGKEGGSKRQLAEGLHALLAHPAAGEALLENAREWERATVELQLDAARRVRWTDWQQGPWHAVAPAPR